MVAGCGGLRDFLPDRAGRKPARCIRRVHGSRRPKSGTRSLPSSRRKRRPRLSHHSGWPARLSEAGILPTATSPEWTALGFDTLQPSQDFAVVGQRSFGCRDGLGVPLIARRTLNNAEEAVWKPYGPRDAVFAATAVIQPRGTVTTWREQPAELVLHDPLREESSSLGRRSVPLAGDLTSPLIERLTQSLIRNYEALGTLHGKIYSTRAGVYAVDTYQAGKMPVVLVQGLWSSPTVWIPMLERAAQ